MTAFSEPIDLTAPVDDLTTSSCVRCGTRYELTRPNSLLVDGVWYGEILCGRCLLRAELVAAVEAKIARQPVCRVSEGCPICDRRRAQL